MAPRKADNLQHNAFVFNALRFIPAIVQALNTSVTVNIGLLAFKLLQLNESELFQLYFTQIES
jgi:ABC-type tungstate transport system substrate-binding protein